MTDVTPRDFAMGEIESLRGHQLWLGCGQAVRHRALNPTSVGIFREGKSSPSSPANPSFKIRVENKNCGWSVAKR
ncbi:MAG: hypothetical protein UV01_C0008G0046 [Parcubacteria group bacterium GW2011_GWA2_42_14]|nr:MAG: hypothetical protein UV01_C0008G0046 [Parcubacteria group bacterium GW2011_GWA2_42_14]